MVQARALPRPFRALDWLHTHRELSIRYLVENVSISGASQLRSFIVGAVAGLAAVGYVRASEILMGPFIVVLMGISQVAVPEASRVFHRESRHLARFCFILGGVQASAAIVWGAILLTVFPLGPGPLLLKELWMPTAQLLPAITLTVAAASFITAATAGLRAMGVARRSLRAQLTGSVAYVICGAAGAVLAGAVGTSWGVTVAQTFAALVWWHQLRSALANHHAVPAVSR
jgi:O-antigen/teichoic acid export membrane protein